MALREILARFGIAVDAKQLAAANTGILGAIGSLKTFGALIAGSAIVRGVSSFVSDMVSVGDELGKTSKQFGIGVTALQRWQVAAQLSGASIKELNVGLRTLAKNTLLAEQGSKQAAEGFKELGVDVKDSNGQLKDTETIFRETGLALGRMENNTKRTALAQQLLGRSGVKLIPLFQKGEKELDKLLKKLDDYGGGIGPEAVKLSEEAADEFLLFGVATDSLKSKLAVALLPILSQVVGAISKFISRVGKLLEGTNLLQASMVVLGGILAKLGFAALGRIGLRALLGLAKAVLVPLAKFALLVLIVDDLITFFKGGESVIGKFLDALGFDSKAVVKEISAISSALVDLIFNFGKSTKDADGFITDNETRFTKLASSLASATDQIAKDFAEFFDLISEDLSAWALGVVNDMIKAGEDLVKGFIDGLKSGVTAIENAIDEVFGPTPKRVNKILGNQSPSKIAAEAGINWNMGLARGLMQSAGLVRPELAGERLLRGVEELRAAAGSIASTAATAPARGATSPTIARGGVIFKTEITIPITGGMPNDAQLSKLRQSMRRSLDDNRRATLAALQQVAAEPTV